MLSVPDGTCLDLLWQEQDSLEGPNPGALLDPLCGTDAVGQAGHGAGAQTHLPGQVPEPLRDLGRRRRRGRAAGAHQPPQGVQGAVHRALAIPVVGTHVTSWGTNRENTINRVLLAIAITSATGRAMQTPALSLHSNAACTRTHCARLCAAWDGCSDLTKALNKKFQS